MNLTRQVAGAFARLLLLASIIVGGVPAQGQLPGIDQQARGTANQALNIANTAMGTATTALSTANGLASQIASKIAPTNSIPPSFTGTRSVASALTGNTGVWTGSPTFACNWQRGGTNISGATSCSTYTLVTADGSQSITFSVTATNAFGSTTVVSLPLLVNPASNALAFSDMLSTYHTGVNMAGHEFISGGFPGKCGGGPWPLTADHIAYYASAGAKVIRLPFAWEELQPQVYGPLGQVIPGYSNCANFLNTVAEMHASLALADAGGMKVMLDNHGYGGRSLQNPTTLVWTSTGGTGRNGIYAIGSTQVPCAAFADFWSKMATEFKNDNGVLGWDLMNEPVSVPNNAAGLTACYQAAITAIRSTGDTHLIFIEPLGYAIAEGVVSNNPTGTIETLTDPANSLVYEGHEYEDNNRTGTYASTELQAPIPSQDLNLLQTRLAPFVAWCSSFSLHCMIGEFGVPNENNWEEIERRGYVYMRANSLPRVRWADWPGTNDNILNPRDPTGATVRRGMAILKASASNDNTTLGTALGLDTLGLSTALPATGTAGATYTGQLTHFWRDSTIAFTYGSCTGGTLAASTATKAITGNLPTSAGACPISAVETLAGIPGSPKTTLLGTITLTGANAVPGAPTINVTAGSAQNSIAFTDGSANGSAITSHKVYRGATGAETLFSTITSATPYVNTGLTNGTSYCYKLTAVNGIGESASSNEQCATPVSSSTIATLPTPTLLQDFESTSGLTIAGATASATVDTTHFVHGSAGVNIAQATPSNATLAITFSVGTRTPQSLGTMAAWIDRQTEGNITAAQMTLFQGATSNVVSFQNEQNAFLPGGRWIAANVSEFTGVNALTTSAAMTARVAFNQQSPYGASGTVDAFYANVAGRPTVVPVFDDATIETFTNVFPIMSNLGLKGTVAVPINYIGATNRMTLANLQTLYAAGWDMACNTTSDVPMTTTATYPTVQSVVDDLNACRTYLVAHGMPRAASHVDLSNGVTTLAISQALQAAGFLTMRGSEPQDMFTRFGIGAGTILRMPSQGFSSSAPSSQCTIPVDTVISRGTTQFYAIHDVSNSPSSIGFQLAAFTTCANYWATNVNSGALDVLTWSQFYTRDGAATAP